MASMIEAVDDNNMRKMIEAIIMGAYKVPRYSTKENQKQAIEKFRDGIYLECFKSFKNSKAAILPFGNLSVLA